ncbi:hydrogenase maturation nickel metallochaperone HypA [Photobacterium phosphoreum]|uniref:hydrogenase maturation nickel metallochaperone HypA n=1 Tax=Photobacterium phosphoreum TaxID=659 RepID=UPI0005D3ECD0|nr:hydrogenase maturation nickel metallochaperone HypA [Photobacterium phosphoreum]KJF84679.1 hydrogenase nickel incorporation protein HypA [Photobacterium phosphoreum]MCD9474755.1 hydrogenase maturation nickel metallochaperone HypA [Photobacterium phosphoreum]MCD9511025.1 hydrogenase maturation nickel metallochaperone HypA [Photobacterium phosphoreum]MCF2175537.1 hydrogenase maturation nickel metallochaperone HypA [Photobacterium phosphoreum]PQJ91296.1 hydrogenase maturation nickel metallocha
MHEYSIVGALIEQCEQHARDNNADKVTRVAIKVGILSGVEPALLETAFQTFKLESICHEAEFEMNIQPLVLSCLECGQETTHTERSIICQHCGSNRTHVLDGEDLMLMQLEVEQSKDV